MVKKEEFPVDPPVITVAIASYNHQDFIQDCIKSVIGQSYRNIELIVIDDGSKDSSVERINELRSACEERFVRFEFRSRSNVGLSRTLNEAIDWSAGKYLCPVASDDMVLEDKISALAPHLEEDNSLPAVFGGALVVDDEGKLTGEKITLRNKYYSFADIFLLRANIPAIGSLIRISDLNNAGGFDPEVKVEDLDMWLKLTKNGQLVKTVSVFVALSRRHTNNFSNQTMVMHDQIRKILFKYRKHSLYKKCLQRMDCLVFRDYSRINRLKAIKLLPKVLYMFWDIRLYHGLFIMLFGRG